MLSETTKLEANTDLMSTDMEGEVVMMHIEEGQYFSLSEGVGARIWELISDKPSNISELVDAISTEYDVAKDTCLTDVRAFIDTLISHNIVKPQ